MKEIVSILKKSHSAIYFLDPVNLKQNSNYASVIKHPMDLGTIMKKILKYRNLENFIYDLYLIWENCRIYNHEESVNLYLN